MLACNGNLEDSVYEHKKKLQVSLSCFDIECHANLTNIWMDDASNSQPERKRSTSSGCAFWGIPSSKTWQIEISGKCLQVIAMHKSAIFKLHEDVLQNVDIALASIEKIKS